MILHGLNDNLIAVSHSYELFEACPSEKKVLVTPEKMSHNVFNLKNDFLVPIKSFLDEMKLIPE